MANASATDLSQVTEYFSALKDTIDRCDLEEWQAAIDLIDQTWKADAQTIVFGNGGSALAAQHAVTDWNKSLYLASGRRFRGISLADNMGIFSAYANDVCYEDVFLEQLRPIVCEGDLVVAISGSGNSENVVRAVKYAKEQGAKVICLTGFDGGKVHEFADINVHIPIHDMQVAEDMHVVFIHNVIKNLMHRNMCKSL
ncbi:SIS domain-containing protein [Novipirellula sp.]|uniref:D-sedoheptulose-7-phosphate isomerase n=1 Tax=Novipirellula sp. TaxID=2795430 RepID=UPI003561DBE4